MRWRTPGTRHVSRGNRGQPDRNRPSAKIVAPRLTIFHGSPIVPRDNVIETPTMKRKNGKTRSVGVQPCQDAWSSGG